ncbi:MAG: ABC transporter substrate-binding protein [SAR324 cluster bacterium]|nr:ABC transporter substrate-binding protein [SAR324 cluster bacterium]
MSIQPHKSRTIISIVLLCLIPFFTANAAKVKIGILLPYTGTYAKLGTHIRDALMLRIEQNKNTLGGREVEYISVDSEMNVPKSTSRINKLVKKDKVDFLVGPVHSGIGINMARLVKKSGTITIVPNAGANQITGTHCAPNIFRTSFTSWQLAYPMGGVMRKAGHKRVVMMYWNYTFGRQTKAAFAESFSASNEEVIDIPTPFPKAEFQSYFTKIATLHPDAVFAFYSGGGAVQFVKDYAASGLKDAIPLYSTFLTEGTAKAQGSAADGIVSILHYSRDLDNEANQRLKRTFKAKTGEDVDIFAVQGYDTGSLLVQAMDAVAGDTFHKKALIQAMESVVIDSPRGPFTFSKAHNPIQTIYLRQTTKGENKIIGVAAKNVEDPATGCQM